MCVHPPVSLTRLEVPKLFGIDCIEPRVVLYVVSDSTLTSWKRISRLSPAILVCLLCLEKN